MKFQPDNPELTAYALGELDASEAAAVAAAVENSAECRQAVEETRETAGLLTSALKTETCPALSATQRAAIETALASAPKVPAKSKAAPAQPSFLAAWLAWRPQLSTVVTWATACLVAVVGWSLWLEVFCKSDRDRSQQVTAYAIKLNPKPATPLPPPPPAANQLAMKTAVLPSVLSGAILSNGTLAVGSYVSAQTGSSNSFGMVAKLGAGTPHAVNWSTFHGGLDINNNGNTYVIGGGGGTRMTGNGIMNKLGGAYATINGSSWVDGNPAGAVQAGQHRGNGFSGSIVNFNGGTLQAARMTDNNGASVNDGYLTLGGTLNPPGEIVFLNGGTLVLSGNNSYSGGVVLGAGRISYRGPTVINSGTLVLTNAVLNGAITFATAPYQSQFGTESYTHIRDNPFLSAAEQPLSTFSIDVDTASYANVRRFLMQGSVPPRDAVRIEEMVNYFTYDYAKPKRGEPFSVNIEAAGCPWNAEHRLVRIGLKGREVSAAKRPPCNLVFLIDVSGSMADANKLSLIKPAMRMLVEQLTENERVAIVVYNETARVALPSTSGDRKQEIIDAIESLQAGGSTNGADGIRLAYDMATRN
ncbi:MAG: von Willebrand factor type A domain-containing protein, partial [Verrucomicrobia bacterium]|nr:von Willebrand factor type A domain-containing protein [Verrucomicrobiota bacterium]